MESNPRLRAGLRAYAGAATAAAPRSRNLAVAGTGIPAQPKQQSSFENFSASELYCPKCKRAMPVREKLLLVLLDCSLYNYLCAGCGEVLGERRA